MEMDVRVFLQPCLDFRGGMGGEVVQDHVDLFARVGCDGFLGFLEEGEEVGAVAGGLAFAEDLAGADVQRGEPPARRPRRRGACAGAATTPRAWRGCPARRRGWRAPSPRTPCARL